MTGNTKVWRAPLAGLASLAMIATMGVSALTATADEAKTFTFDVDGTNLKFDTKANVSGVTVAKDGKSAAVTDGGDGYLDKSDVVKAELALDPSYQSTYTLTGWENASGTLVATDAANADKVTDTTVTARYARSTDVYNVVFSGVYTVADVPVAKADGKLASWQFPTDTDRHDGKLLTGFVADKQTSQAVTADTDLANVVTKGSNEADVKAVTVDSAAVTFSSTDHSGKSWTLNTKNEGNDYVVEVEKGKTLADAGVKELPVASQPSTDPYGTATTRYTSTFSAASGKDAKAITLSTAISANVTVKPNYGVSEGYTVTFVSEGKVVSTQLVAADKTITKPADPTKKDDTNVKWAFKAWQLDGKDYDFSKNPGKNITLTAKFEASSIRVQFDPNYGKEPVASKWFSTGDYFEAPVYARDGYELSWPGAPEGAKLTIDGTNLKYVVNNEETAAKTGTITAGQTFKADWNKLAQAEYLTQIEGRVDRNLKDSEAKKWYTLASYNQYKKDFQDYLADKAEAAKNGYTEKKYKELLSKVKALQAKIVEVGDTPLYRVYNPNNGDHYFTTDKNEASHLVNLGWKAEGAPYKVVADRYNSVTFGTEDDGTARVVHVSASLGTELHSVYNPNTG
ncbi:KxYKxGKxW signal peptide, partial [Bifidobacterium goeldii]